MLPDSAYNRLLLSVVGILPENAVFAGVHVLVAIVVGIRCRAIALVGAIHHIIIAHINYLN